jgi:hypothetical protein
MVFHDLIPNHLFSVISGAPRFPHPSPLRVPMLIHRGSHSTSVPPQATFLPLHIGQVQLSLKSWL